MESSMLSTLKQKQSGRLTKQISEGSKPIRIEWGGGGTLAQIQFSDGKTSPGSCIRCANPSCMEYSSSELELEIFSDFPADRNNSVCPTGAIRWPLEENSPIIDEETCISCGLCVSRCPVRAIYLDINRARINDEPNKHFVIQNFPATEESTAATVAMFDGIHEDGVYRVENDAILESFFSHFPIVAAKQSAQFPNHLARNLLIACGVGAAMGRRGDTNVRMDMVLGPPGVERGTGEVELGNSVLDAPRNIIDNVAVLMARYEIERDHIVPLIVSFSLPNQRSEYWQVIKDIRTVINVNINSITIGALAILVWNRAKIEIRTGEEFYIDTDSPSLRPSLERILGRSLSIVTGYPGCLENEK